MPPQTRTNEEVLKQAIDESSEKAVEKIYDKLNQTLGSGSKIRQILEKSRGPSEAEKLAEEKHKLEEVKKGERLVIDAELEKLQKHAEESEVYCPTCSSHGHEHTLKRTSKGTMKCSGGECNEEFILVPTNTSYACEDCHTPHLRPKNKDDELNDSCPMCGGNHFTRTNFIGLDYDKIRERVNKTKGKK